MHPQVMQDSALLAQLFALVAIEPGAARVNTGEILIKYQYSPPGNLPGS